MKTVLITGGNGFAGSHLTEILSKNKNIDVRCLVRQTSDLKWLKDLNVTYVQGDVMNPESLENAVRDVDVVFHLAGLTKSNSEDGYFQVNGIGTTNLLKAVVRWNPSISRFVYVSSQAAAGPSIYKRPVVEQDEARPVSHYGKSKLAGEEAVEAFSQLIPTTIIRPPVIYGPRDLAGFNFFKIITKGVKPILGLREQIQSFLYVDDFVKGLLLASEKEIAVGKTYFLTSDPFVTWSHLVDLITDELKIKVYPLYIPLWIFSVIGIINDIKVKFTKQALDFSYQKAKEMRAHYWICDDTLARKELGYKPDVPLKDGLRQCVAWYRDAGWI